MNNVTSDNRFLRVLIAAQRARQIHKGARPLVQKSNTRATRIALEEVDRGLINYEFIQQNPDLKSGRDNRDVSGHDDDDGRVNREVTNQPSVSSLLSVGRLSD
jgi:DNA-directed RNA polymerase omega subunit